MKNTGTKKITSVVGEEPLTVLFPLQSFQPSLRSFTGDRPMLDSPRAAIR